MSLPYVVDGETDLDSLLLNPIIAGVNTATAALPDLQAASAQQVAVGALRARNRMVVSMGDSIAGTGIQDYGPTSSMWLANACVQLDGKLVWSGVYSEPGYTTAQVRATVLPRVVAADVLPGFCAIMCGANDAYSMATFRTEYGAILDGLLAANIIPIICALVPNNTSGNHIKIHAYNTWLARECGRRGLVFVNWTGAIVDPTTAGSWNSGNSADGTHPNTTGAQLMADVFADTMESYFAAGVTVDPYLANCNLDPSTLQLANSDPRNCLMRTDTGSNGSADGWAIVNNGSAASVLSIENPSSSDTLGKWQRLTRADNDGSNSSRLWTPVPYTGLTAGDLVFCGFRIKSVIESASPAGTLGAWDLHDGATGPLGTDPRRSFMGSGWAKDIPATTLYQEVVARSGVSNAYLIFDFASGEGYFQVGQFTLRNLTALGID